jgi:hypothetical protein
MHTPTLYTILAVDSVLHYPYEVTFEIAANYEIVIIHTLGTSGKPKPIGCNTKYLGKIDQGDDLQVHQGELLVRTTLPKSALVMLPCKCRGIVSSQTMYNADSILVRWTDLPYIYHHT